MATPRKVQVRIAKFRAVTVDGRLYEAGETVAVPAPDAKTLIEEGFAEKAGR